MKLLYPINSQSPHAKAFSGKSQIKNRDFLSTTHLIFFVNFASIVNSFPISNNFLFILILFFYQIVQSCKSS